MSHNVPELIEDVKRKKEALTVTELIQLLKDYGKYYLTSHAEVGSLVRDINLHLQGRRVTQDLDFEGFELYVLQFCLHSMTIPHQIVIDTTIHHNHRSAQTSHKLQKNLRGQPFPIILTEFFKELKGTFLSKGQRVDVFEDLEDLHLSGEQTAEVNRLTNQLQVNPQFILPLGFKKIEERVMNYHY